MLTVDRFTVDDSVVDDSFVEARDFVTDSKASRLRSLVLLVDSDKNLMNHSDDGDEFMSTPVPSCTDYIKQNLIRGQTRNVSVS